MNLLLSWGFAIGWFQFLPSIPLIPLPGSENHSFLLPFQARVGTRPFYCLGMHHLLWFPSILLLCNQRIQTLTDTDVRSIKKGCIAHYSSEVEEATNCPVGGRRVGFTGDVWALFYRMRHFLWITLNRSLKSVLTSVREVLVYANLDGLHGLKRQWLSSRLKKHRKLKQ